MNRIVTIVIAIALLAGITARVAPAATNSLDSATFAQTIIGGQTNMLKWSLNFTPSTVAVTPWLRGVFVAQSLEPRSLDQNLKSGDSLTLASASTNSVFVNVAQSNTITFSLGGRETFWVMSTNAVSVTNNFDINFTK